MSEKKKREWQSWFISGLFCSLIFGILAAAIVRPPAEFSETENRVLAQRPRITAEAVARGEFQADYETYLTDQFVLRDRWIGIKTSVERLLFRRESKDIYFGKDGYLIEKHTGSFSSAMAQRNLAALERFTQQYESRFGPGHMTVMLVPDAVEILKQKLPPFADPNPEAPYLEQAAGRLPDGVWLDLTPVLQAHQEEELYYRTDHHWKGLAAFYGYQAWAKERGYYVPELSEYEIKTVTKDFQGTIQSRLGIKTAGDTIQLFLPKEETPYFVRDESGSCRQSLYDESALKQKDKYAVYFGGNQAFLQIHTESDSGRRILVIKDSYANCFVPFMLREFQQIDMLDIRYTKRRVSEWIAEGRYTDLLVLYHAAGFAEDMSIVKLTG